MRTQKVLPLLYTLGISVWDTSPIMRLKPTVPLPLLAWILMALPLQTHQSAVGASLASPLANPFLRPLLSGHRESSKLCIVISPVLCRLSPYKAQHTPPPS